MALILCPECGHKVSDRAEECPKCGYPLHEQAEEAGSPAAATTPPVAPGSVPSISSGSVPPAAPVPTEASDVQPKTAAAPTASPPAPQETPVAPKATPPAPKESARETKRSAKEKQSDKGLLPYIIGVVLLVLETGAGLWWAFFHEPSDTAPAKTTASAASAASGSDDSGRRTYTVNGVAFIMVTVEGGTFTMGAPDWDDSDDDERPRHRVTVSQFAIGQTEVTQALWTAVMGQNPSQFRDPNRPVDNVSWEDCQAFIRELNRLTGERFRLPTEAEWEYAARGGRKSRSHRYSGSDLLDDVAWHGDNSGGTTHPVGTKQENELGLHDMSGNVWEWCQDWKGDYGRSSQVDPKGPGSGSQRVLRGGCWLNVPKSCRVTMRGNREPSGRENRFGLRLAL